MAGYNCRPLVAAFEQRRERIDAQAALVLFVGMALEAGFDEHRANLRLEELNRGRRRFFSGGKTKRSARQIAIRPRAEPAADRLSCRCNLME